MPTAVAIGGIRLGLCLNAALAGAMLAAATWGGASTLLVLAVQFVAAVGCQALLLHGLARSRAPEPGKCNLSGELHFWNSVVATLLYALAAGIALNEGLNRLAAPRPISDGSVNFAVIGGAVPVVGFLAWNILSAAGLRELLERPADAIRTVADPVLGLSLLQSLAALASLLTALVGIGIAAMDGMPFADGLTAVLIGLILAAVAVLAALQTRSFLAGRQEAIILQGRTASGAEPNSTMEPMAVAPQLTSLAAPQQSQERSAPAQVDISPAKTIRRPARRAAENIAANA